MPVLPQDWWKLAVLIALVGAIVAIARATRPGTAISPLIAGALVLYAAGATLWVTHRVLIACGLYIAGIASATLAVWRSRGGEADEPPGREYWDGEQPPDDPGGRPQRIDWDAFERDLSVWEAGRRETAARR